MVAGGSTSSLAAAITAAEAAPELRICFTEITDWPGGQMSSGGVPAIDFDGLNRLPSNWPASFKSAMDSIPGDKHLANINGTNDGSGSPGACSVSTVCYLPNVWVEEWVMPRLAASKNLQVFLRTAVVKAERDPETGAVTSVHAVQRSPVAGHAEWTQRLSVELPDWYTATDSAAFSKQLLQFKAAVFVEATELGDVLATSGLEFLQGLEAPFENSSNTGIISDLGQAATLTFYAELLPHAAAAVPFPAGNPEGHPVTVNLTETQFRHTWSWRRSYCNPDNTSLNAANVGDITQQNLGNDLDAAYLFPALDAVKAEAASGWHGGVNLTALHMLEERAYWWFSMLRQSGAAVNSSAFGGNKIGVSTTTSGTKHGLSKMVYWRDTRRAVGVDAFKLYHTQLRDDTPSSSAAVHFADSVAIGCYNDDCHHLRNATVPGFAILPSYPAYLNDGRGEGGKPYYIPFRALMVGDAPNLLVAGKLMSESFHANANTRLHPSEWTSGVAAGGAAALMLREAWTDTRQAYANIRKVQAFLNSSVVGQPLDWTGLPPPPKAPTTTCALQRCIGLDPAAANRTHSPTYANDTALTCKAACQPLAGYEWLANAAYWTEPTTHGGRSYIYSKSPTTLKKSTALSGTLPPDEVLQVGQDQPCILEANATLFEGYWLCIHHLP